MGFLPKSLATILFRSIQHLLFHTHTHTPSIHVLYSLSEVQGLEWYRPTIQGLVVVVPLSTAARTLVIVQALPVEEPTTMRARVKMWLSVCLALMVD